MLSLEDGLDVLAVVVQLQQSVLIEPLVLILQWVVNVTRNVRLPAVARLIIQTRNWAHTDILVHEVLVCEVVEHLLVLDACVLLTLDLTLVELLADEGAQRVEVVHQVSWHGVKYVVTG